MNAPQSTSFCYESAALLSKAIQQEEARCPRTLLLQLIDLAPLPLPGSGFTLERWRALANIAGYDLSCAKFYESHADALAILRELGHSHLVSDKDIWAVWCAEPPNRKVHISAPALPGSMVQIDGTKAWCSGASLVDRALLSAWDTNNKPCLVAADMSQAEIRVTNDGWNAVGMAATASVDVEFNAAIGTVVGTSGSYVARPGFHHGAAGIAACWYGAAQSIASHVHQRLKQQSKNEHATAHLGAMDVVLSQAACLLRAAAAEIDKNPEDSCELVVRRTRLAVESAAETVLYRTPRALGAGPMCKDRHLAQQLADLPVFIRQSHAERDQAAHGHRLLHLEEERLWTL